MILELEKEYILNAFSAFIYDALSYRRFTKFEADVKMAHKSPAFHAHVLVPPEMHRTY